MTTHRSVQLAGPGPGALAGRRRTGGARRAGSLTLEQRQTVIDQALLMLEAIYANLPLKRALHAIDPIQRLRLLRLRHEALDEREFQSGDDRDLRRPARPAHQLHAAEAYRPKFAYLPFRVEEFYEGGERKYLVSWVSPKNTDAEARAGVEVTHWNGMPIDLAVARNAAREAGSNTEARRAQGLEALTLRWFGMSLPPDEDWVDVDLRRRRDDAESRLEWDVIDVRSELRQPCTHRATSGSAQAAGSASTSRPNCSAACARRSSIRRPFKAETEMASAAAAAAPGRGAARRRQHACRTSIRASAR